MVKRVLREFPVLLRVYDGNSDEFSEMISRISGHTQNIRDKVEKYCSVLGTYQIPSGEFFFYDLPRHDCPSHSGIWDINKLSERVTRRLTKGDYQLIQCNLVYPKPIKAGKTDIGFLDALVDAEEFLISSKDSEGNNIFGQIYVSRDRRKFFGLDLSWELALPMRTEFHLAHFGFKQDGFNLVPYQKNLPERLEPLFPEYHG